MIQKRDTYLPTCEDTTNPYTYAVAEDIGEIAQAMQALAHAGIAQMALVTIRLHFTATAKMYASEIPYADQHARPYLDTLRPLVRKTDKVFLLGATLYFVLLNANLQGGSIVQERLWDALHWHMHHDHNTEMRQPYSMTIGHSAYPMPSQDAQQCIAAARVACLRFEQSKKASQQIVTQPVVGTAELAAQARQLHIPYLSMLPRQLPTNIKRLISTGLAQELHCYPLGCEQDKLTVAMLNPQDQQALERLRQETGMRIFPVLTSSRELQRVLEQLI